MLVMIVDDSPTIRMLVSIWLQKEGWKVVACEDGIKAMEWMVRQQRIPHVVLLDVCLPRLDGFEVALRLRRCCRQTVIILLSAQEGLLDHVKGRLAGIQG